MNVQGADSADIESDESSESIDKIYALPEINERASLIERAPTIKDI